MSAEATMDNKCPTRSCRTCNVLKCGWCPCRKCEVCRYRLGGEAETEKLKELGLELERLKAEEAEAKRKKKREDGEAKRKLLFERSAMQYARAKGLTTPLGF